jgi:hypothetical protein
MHGLRPRPAACAAPTPAPPRPAPRSGCTPVERPALGEELGLARVRLRLADGGGGRGVRLGRTVQGGALGHGRARDAADGHGGRLVAVQQRDAQGGAVEHRVHHGGHRLALAHPGHKVDGHEACKGREGGGEGSSWEQVHGGCCWWAGRVHVTAGGQPRAGGCAGAAALAHCRRTQRGARPWRRRPRPAAGSSTAGSVPRRMRGSGCLHAGRSAAAHLVPQAQALLRRLLLSGLESLEVGALLRAPPHLRGG